MKRALWIWAGVSAVLLAFFFSTSGVSPETRYYADTSAVLFLVILVVVAVASLITYVIVRLLNNRVGDRLAAKRLPRFIGWNLLRSHKLRPTVWSRIRQRFADAGRKPLGPKLARAALGVALVAAALLIERPQVFNAIADAANPISARVVQLVLLGFGGLLVASAITTVVAGIAHRGGGRAPALLRFKPKSAVTVPTFISIVGVAIGVWALIVVLGVMQGLQGGLRDRILSTDAHIVVEPENADGVLDAPLHLETQLRAIDGVVEAHAFIHGEVMASTPTGIAVNVVIKGMDEDALQNSLQLKDMMVSGGAEWVRRPEGLIPDRQRYPLGGGREQDDEGSEREKLVPRAKQSIDLLPGLLIGAELGRSLHANVGDEVQLIIPDGDVGPTGLRPKLRSFRVAGIFRTGMYEFDQKRGYIALDEAQRFFNYGPDLNRLEARIANVDETDRIMAQLNGVIDGGEEPARMVASDWRARNRTLFSALELERVIIFVLLVFIIFVSSLLIVSSLVMLVVEKVRDIALLKALGASDKSVVRAFIVIGSFIGVMGALAGTTLGVVTCKVLVWKGLQPPDVFYIEKLPVEIEPFQITLIAVSAIAICLIATIYPSMQAAKLSPSEGLHG